MEQLVRRRLTLLGGGRLVILCLTCAAFSFALNGDVMIENRSGDDLCDVKIYSQMTFWSTRVPDGASVRFFVHLSGTEEGGLQSIIRYRRCPADDFEYMRLGDYTYPVPGDSFYIRINPAGLPPSVWLNGEPVAE